MNICNATGNKRLLILLIATAGLAAVGCLNAKPEDEAKKSAEQWLALVDVGKFSESWDAAGTYLQHAVTKDVWERKLDQMRKPLGALVTRDLKNTKLDKGDNFFSHERARLSFATSFEKKKDDVETVTLGMYDGIWKVVGYYIEPGSKSSPDKS